jgi:hypothetical protein
MVLARELAKRLTNFVVVRGLRNSQRLVIISELNCHGSGEVLRGLPPAQLERNDEKIAGPWRAILQALATASACIYLSPCVS